MKRVVYVGPSDAVELVDRTLCRRNEPVELPDELVQSLLEQVDTWQPASSGSAKSKPTPATNEEVAR